jgi:carboxyl-terminal processing protease
MNSLILDLRNNPGGLLDTAVKVAEFFLPEGQIIVSTKGRIKDQNVVYKASYSKPYVNFPLLILVNSGSASASEIIAGAVKDSKRGLVVGEKTFGKGSVQTVIPMGDGSALRLTTARYFTPNGRQINNEGIIPDVVIPLVKVSKGKEKDVLTLVEDDEEDEDIPVKSDIQLMRALDLIKGITAYETLKAPQK